MLKTIKTLKEVMKLVLLMSHVKSWGHKLVWVVHCLTGDIPCMYMQGNKVYKLDTLGKCMGVAILIATI